MFRSISKDVKSWFDYGNMVTKLILVNIIIFVITALVEAFFPFFYQYSILPYIALPGDVSTFIYRPWTLISHMFIHTGIWHLAWNMITLFWFGTIAGDLLGDRRILPVYIMGGLMGALFYILSFQFLLGIGSMAVGASAAALAIVFMAIIIAPEYVVHLILLGPVRIKYIGLFILFMDLIGTQSGGNTGGHIAHFGGVFFGFLFVHLLRKGIDLSEPRWLKLKDKSIFTKKTMTRKGPLKVAHKSASFGKSKSPHPPKESFSDRVDDILDKIKSKGYDSLSAEEKEILYEASKK